MALIEFIYVLNTVDMLDDSDQWRSDLDQSDRPQCVAYRNLHELITNDEVMSNRYDL